MITLDDPLWKQLKGGYKIPYDPSPALKQLELARDPNLIDKIYNELWNELHHQGDVDVVSYLTVPQLVRIAKQNNILNWNLFAICATIEQQRVLGKNPALPEQYREYYHNGLAELKEFIIDNLKSITDEITFSSAISALAACNQYTKLSKAIINMSDDVLDEFPEQY